MRFKKFAKYKKKSYSEISCKIGKRISMREQEVNQRLQGMGVVRYCTLVISYIFFWTRH